MSILDRDKTPPPKGTDHLHPESHEPQKKGGHAHWMMIACCIPMLAIAIILVATGVAGAGFIFVALMCTAMMAMMMMGMRGGGQGGGGQ